MKKLILVALMLCSLSVQALELRMYQVNDRLRIVISNSECGWRDGKQASAQRLDGLYFKGCWVPMEKFPHMIHIDWSTGDFSELPYEEFKIVSPN